MEPDNTLEAKIRRALTFVEHEVSTAIAKFKPFGSSHEGFAIILEEVDELWEEVRANNLEAARKEAIQVAAMAIRYLVDLPDTKHYDKEAAK